MYSQITAQELPNHQRIKRIDSHNEDEDTNLQIIKQGYGIHEALKADILQFYNLSRTQQEYKNPADYIKHRLDDKYGPFWFVFMWELKNGLNAQYSYYNNDDRVFEFKLNGWHVLIYSFNQSKQNEQFNQQFQGGQTVSNKNIYGQMQPGQFRQENNYHNDPRVDPRYGYPSMQPYQQYPQGPSQFRQGGWYQ